MDNPPAIYDQMSLEGKVAIVTGSGRGLGRAMALALAEAGADLVVMSRTGAEIEETARTIEEMGRKALAFRADVTLPDEVDEVVRQTMDLFGRIDILVNNVGVATVKPLEEMTLKEWWDTLNTNLTSLFLFCKAAGPPMIVQRRGKVINVSSIDGAGGQAGLVAYCASKGGVIQFTRALAVEWAKYNIQVNGIGPGAFYTRPMAVVLDDEKLGPLRRKKIPLGREGRPDELGPLVVYLASSASDFMTGETIFIDGGELAKL
jgi:NAD(P)-dependent dehydrogenase (short-subunit alcohol dehydrogenase family)